MGLKFIRIPELLCSLCSPLKTEHPNKPFGFSPEVTEVLGDGCPSPGGEIELRTVPVVVEVPFSERDGILIIGKPR